MMMKMLQEAGFEILTDGIRTADEDNPKGYYEYEKVKNLHNDSTWMYQAEGKVIKVISMQLFHLPPLYQYNVVFMERKIEEIIQSQNAMIKRRHQEPAADDSTIHKLFTKHLACVSSWLDQQKNISTCKISFNKMLTAPEEEIERLNIFLGGHLDKVRLFQVIDKSLYRKKNTGSSAESVGSTRSRQITKSMI
jgi:hypothetical protein